MVRGETEIVVYIEQKSLELKILSWEEMEYSEPIFLQHTNISNVDRIKSAIELYISKKFWDMLENYNFNFYKFYSGTNEETSMIVNLTNDFEELIYQVTIKEVENV
jgi:hypothetical protein